MTSWAWAELTRIYVKNLFGTRSLDIHLRDSSSLAFLASENGRGKSSMFKLLASVFPNRFDAFDEYKESDNGSKYDQMQKYLDTIDSMTFDEIRLEFLYGKSFSLYRSKMGNQSDNDPSTPSQQSLRFVVDNGEGRIEWDWVLSLPSDRNKDLAQGTKTDFGRQSPEWRFYLAETENLKRKTENLNRMTENLNRKTENPNREAENLKREAENLKREAENLKRTRQKLFSRWDIGSSVEATWLLSESASEVFFKDSPEHHWTNLPPLQVVFISSERLNPTSISACISGNDKSEGGKQDVMLLVSESLKRRIQLSDQLRARESDKIDRQFGKKFLITFRA